MWIVYLHYIEDAIKWIIKQLFSFVFSILLFVGLSIALLAIALALGTEQFWGNLAFSLFIELVGALLIVLLLEGYMRRRYEELVREFKNVSGQTTGADILAKAIAERVHSNHIQDTEQGQE